MTNNEVIIDYTKCKYNTFDGGGSQRTICSLDGKYCDCLRDKECYYKQLQAKTAECEKLKEENEKLEKNKIKIEMSNGAVITPEELEKMTKCNCMLCDKLGFTEDGLFKCYVTGEVMTHEGDAIAYNCKHYKEWKE